MAPLLSPNPICTASLRTPKPTSLNKGKPKLYNIPGTPKPTSLYKGKPNFYKKKHDKFIKLHNINLTQQRVNPREQSQNMKNLGGYLAPIFSINKYQFKSSYISVSLVVQNIPPPKFWEKQLSCFQKSLFNRKQISLLEQDRKMIRMLIFSYIISNLTNNIVQNPNHCHSSKTRTPQIDNKKYFSKQEEANTPQSISNAQRVNRAFLRCMSAR